MQIALELNFGKRQFEARFVHLFFRVDAAATLYKEKGVTQLEFSSAWPSAWLFAVSLILAAISFAFYRRETRSRPDALRWFLPLLRSFGILLITMMICGPRLHYRRIMGQLGRIIICIDSSRSMSLADPGLEPHRKFLALRARGLIPRNAAPSFELASAAEHMASAANIAHQAQPEMSQAQLQEIASQTMAALEKCGAVLKSAGAHGMPKTDPVRRQDLDDLLARARSLGNMAAAPAPWAVALNSFGAELSRHELALREDYANASADASNDLDARSLAAYQRFSETSRWNRLESLLLDPLTGLLRTLAAHHMVEVRSLEGKPTRPLWHSENPAKEPLTIPETFDLSPTNLFTDLASPLTALLLTKRGNQRMAVVLFSDGQHNEGPSPLESAKILGNGGIPLYTIGLGSTNTVGRTGTSAAPGDGESKEWTEATCNEPLLREMASLSGGVYLREEEAGRLVKLLGPVSQGRVVESEPVLWQSWWWFSAIILLFTTEWLLRKRAGLI